MTTLVIVESKAKAEKIGNMLGKKYVVIPSFGHIIDLDPKKMSIDFENNFEPTYVILTSKDPMKDKTKVVKDLKKAYSKVDDILLAADPDREGEMIAWSLARELGVKNPKRISFNSITKKEILEAIQNPGKINDNLVDAQKLRRLLDRIIGYKISPLLWKSIGAGKLSAGRVQSVVVKLIIDKENKVKNFFDDEQHSFFKITGEFLNDNKVFKSILYTTKKQVEESDEETPKKSVKKTKRDKSDSESNTDDSDSDSNTDDSDSDNKIVKRGSVATIL